jgi:hypothetical protein
MARTKPIARATLALLSLSFIASCDTGNTYPFGMNPPASMGVPFADRYIMSSATANSPREIVEHYINAYKYVGWCKVEERAEAHAVLRFDESLIPKDPAAQEALEEAGISTYFSSDADPTYRAGDPHPERRLIEARLNGVRWEYRVRRFYIGSDPVIIAQLKQSYVPAPAPE